jgi:TolB protein
MKRLFCLLALLSWWLATPVAAQMTIDVSGAGARQYPIAITNFPGEAALPESLTQIVRADLERSGLFRIIDTTGISPVPTEPSQVRFGDWTTKSADYLAIGVVVPSADGRLTVRVRLIDVTKQAELASFAFTMAPALTRVTAHRTADEIYARITGEKGFFNTKIAYVKKAGTRFDLIVADYDGQNEQSALTSREPIISPEWSPDGSRLVYVSFENRKPQIWVHELYTSKRTLVGNFRGSNSAPAWSPARPPSMMISLVVSPRDPLPPESSPSSHCIHCRTGEAGSSRSPLRSSRQLQLISRWSRAESRASRRT